MGVKSTKKLTRQQAETLYIDKFIKSCQIDERKRIDLKLDRIDLSSVELPWHIERATDQNMREIYIAMRLALKSSKFEAEARRRLLQYPDDELQSFIENLNDKIHDGEGYENYLIVPEHYMD